MFLSSIRSNGPRRTDRSPSELKMPTSVTGQGKYIKQTVGRDQYGHVVLLLNLHDADTGVMVTNWLGV